MGGPRILDQYGVEIGGTRFPALASLTGLDKADELAVWDASASGLYRATLEEAYKALNTLTELTAVDIADMLAAYDASGSVARRIRADNLIKGVLDTATSESTIADGDEILIKDASANALRRMTKANFVAGVGGTLNGCCAYTTAAINVSSTPAAIPFANEVVDTGGQHDTVTNNTRFTALATKQHRFYVNLGGRANGADYITLFAYKNGSAITGASVRGSISNTQHEWGLGATLLLRLAMTAGDYLEAFISCGSSLQMTGDVSHIAVFEEC